MSKVITENDKAVLERIFNPLTPYDNIDNEEDEVNSEDIELSPEEAEARVLEVDAVYCAERGDTDSAIKLLNKAIEKCPKNPSCYNNRAQAKRLGRDIDGALLDLDSAIELSEGQGKVACQAYTQRAIIYKLQEKPEESLSDFCKASSLGSNYAKQQVALSNPYAAMCNQMLCEMMTKVKEGKM